MKKFIGSIILILFWSNSAGAGYVLNYDAKQIQNGNYPKLTVWNGSGLTLNLTQLKGESVKSIWLDDPSKLVIDYAGELCSSPCRGGVTVLHLKRVTGLNFDNLPATMRTTLTVVTVSSEGDKIYKFILGYGGGSPKYLAVNLTPPVKQRPLPPLFNRPIVPAVQPLIEVAEVKKEVDNERIDLLKKGLQVAREKLKPTENNNLLFDRFDTFISQLESGSEEEETRQKNAISPKAIELVVNFGEEQLLAEEKLNQESEVQKSLVSQQQKLIVCNQVDSQPNQKPEKKLEQETVVINQPEKKTETISTEKQKKVEVSTVMTTTSIAQPELKVVEENITPEEKIQLLGIDQLNSREKANLISRGLLVAQNKKQINYRTRTYYKVQSVIKDLRKGKTLTQASKKARVDLSILHQLLIWGKPKPVKNLSISSSTKHLEKAEEQGSRGAGEKFSSTLSSASLPLSPEAPQQKTIA